MTSSSTCRTACCGSNASGPSATETLSSFAVAHAGGGRNGLIHRGYAPGEIDAVAAYCAELDTCYLLPLSMSVNRTAVQLRLAPTRNNQNRLINWAKDYEFAARLSPLGPIAQLGERKSGRLEAAGSSPAGSIA